MTLFHLVSVFEVLTNCLKQAINKQKNKPTPHTSRERPQGCETPEGADEPAPGHC